MQSATLGARLRQARKARGWSQVRLSAASGVSPERIRRLERGGESALTSTLDLLCMALEVPACVLIGPPCGLSVLHRRSVELLAKSQGLAVEAEALKREVERTPALRGHAAGR